MNLTEQKNILQKLNEEYHKNIIKFNTFININNYIQENTTDTTDTTDSTNTTDTTDTTDSTNINQELNSCEKNNNKINAITNVNCHDIDFGIKKSDLLKIIHPDKISFLINSNQSNINFDTLEFDKQILNNCFIEILNKNLNVVDSLFLIYKKCNLFKPIANQLKLSIDQINTIDQLMMSINNEIFFEQNFDENLIEFINLYNKSNKSMINYIQATLFEIHEIFRTLFNKIGKKIYNSAKKIIDAESLYKKKLFDYNIKFKTNNANLNKQHLDKLDSIYNNYIETFNKYKFDFVIYSNIEHLTIANIVKLCVDNSISIESKAHECLQTKTHKYLQTKAYEYLQNLKNDIPLLYEHIAHAKPECYYGITMPYGYFLLEKDIAQIEYDNFKYNRKMTFENRKEYQLNFDISPEKNTHAISNTNTETNISENIDNVSDDNINIGNNINNITTNTDTDTDTDTDTIDNIFSKDDIFEKKISNVFDRIEQGILYIAIFVLSLFVILIIFGVIFVHKLIQFRF